MTLQGIKKAGNFTANIAHLNGMTKIISQQPARVYEIISKYGGEADTVTREAIFSYIADKYDNGNYDRVYKQWLEI